MSEEKNIEKLEDGNQETDPIAIGLKKEKIEQSATKEQVTIDKHPPSPELRRINQQLKIWKYITTPK